MKKIMMTLAAVAMAATMNAQTYIGGGIGFNNSKNPHGNTETTETGFRIAPEVGYNLDEKWAVGIALDFGYEKDKTEDKASNISSETKTTTFKVKPYARYQALQWGKANIFVDGGVNFGISKPEDYKAGLDLGLFITPGVAFNVSDKWSIVAKLNDMFTLGYSKGSVPDVPNAPDAPTSFEAGLSTGGFNLGSLTFGVYYNF